MMPAALIKRITLLGYTRSRQTHP